jgi:hypothetical protein
MQTFPGTKFCEQCEDFFCDTCFVDQHSKGSLQKHTFEQMVLDWSPIKCFKLASVSLGTVL